jgi:GNAT superfamily N-acetyltransferase
VEITLKTAATDSEWAAAARLLDQYRCWLDAAIGLDLAAAQPAAGGEFGDLASFYRRPDGVLILAWLGACPVGMVGVHRYAGAIGELKRTYAVRAARGRGVGRALVSAAIGAATDLGFEELWLQTEPGTMAAAHRLYRDAGFVDIPAYHDLGVAGVATLGLRLAGPRRRPLTRVVGGPNPARREFS